MQSAVTRIRVGFLSGLMMLGVIACSGGGGDSGPSAPVTPIEMDPVVVDPVMVVGSAGDFTLFSDDTALDERTQLLWTIQDFRQLENRATSNYEEALAWVEQRNHERFRGYDDWRLPTRSEFDALYDPDLPSGSYRDEPVGYPAAFDDGGGEWYWTGDVDEYGDPPNHVHRAWTYSFITGESESRYTFPSHHGEGIIERTGSVRLVRDNGS